MWFSLGEVSHHYPLSVILLRFWNSKGSPQWIGIGIIDFKWDETLYTELRNVTVKV